MIVTLSREYGAAGLGVADGAARALGYDLMTDDLPAVVASRLGTSVEELAARADSTASFSERLLSSLGDATPEALALSAPGGSRNFDEQVRLEVERAVRERAAAGNVVILGRLGNAILAGMPGLVRVFLTASVAWRTERLMESFHFTRERAAAELVRTDAARRRVAKDHYKMTWGDPRNYDLILDTERFGVEGTVSIVVAAVRIAASA